ncbi:restriction endonuclease [Embleya sp. NPDC059237]|uniref:restriction endonuclease n=1 Tax=Embleya sp. NPDC059237 TaxID=3346784 RepID=UPI00367A3319
MDEETFERGMKWVFGIVLVLGAATVSWQWLRGQAWPWMTEHPWWVAAVAGTPVAGLVVLGLGRGYDDFAYVEESDAAEEARAGRTRGGLAWLESVSPTDFEHACADFLRRDGFRAVRRVGGPGDKGADVLAEDRSGRVLVIQCKQFAKPVSAGHVHAFNGTAGPEHGADVAIMVGLNGFTAPAAEFAANHGIHLVGRAELGKWAHGTHLYDLIDVYL